MGPILSTNGPSHKAGTIHGVLVLYRRSDMNPRWVTGCTYGSQPGAVIMQDDGNLVMYDSNWNALWSSNTWQYPGAELHLEDFGRAYIYAPDWSVIWANTPSNTCW